MRSLFLILALAVGINAYSGAKIEWDHTEHDFGAFDESMGPVTAIFTFYNTGDEPLIVSGARANCGCTTPKLSADIVAPGDSATLSVTYDPAGRPGRFEKRVYVDTNTEPKRSNLKIGGVSVGSPTSVIGRFPVEVGPLRLAHSATLLGNVKKGHIKSVFESGYNTSVDTIRPVVTDIPKWLEVKVLSEKVPPGEGASFNFFVNSEKINEWDMVVDTVTIRPFKDSKEAYRMPVVVTVVEDFGNLTDKALAESPEISATPFRLQPTEFTAPTVQATFTITNNGRSPLKIRRLYTTTAGVYFDAGRNLSVKPGKSRQITATISEEALGENDATNIVATIISNDPLNPRTTVNIPVVRKR